VVEYLNGLVARSYAVIYSKSRIDLGKVVRHFVWGYPAVFRRYLPHFLLAAALFAGGTIFGFLAAWFDEDAAQSFLMPANFPTIRPDNAEHEGEAMGGGDLAKFSSFLFTNNTRVTLVAFALGITFGVGTAWFMWYNGVITGVLLAVFVRADKLLPFCTGILPHGVVEIPAMLIGGAAGFVLAQGTIRARPWSRADELARCGREGLLLVSGALSLLVVAAIVEAGVARAPNWVFDSAFKLLVASCIGLSFAAYILLLGWSRDDLRESAAGRLVRALRPSGGRKA
jgi:uncharacterized membrane protein SpoIIM required for sporulation